MSEIFRAKKAFSFTDKTGVRRVIKRGSLMSSSDPSFKGREGLFEPVETHVEKSDARRVGKTETASAAPNEARSISRPVAKKTAASTPPVKKEGGNE